MRCDQFMGLPPEALQFLVKHAVKPTVCECCKQQIPEKREVIEFYDGMFNDQHPLYRIPLVGGEYAEEYLQADPWSSGPVFFHGLWVYKGGKVVKTYTWTDKEIEEAC